MHDSISSAGGKLLFDSSVKALSIGYDFENRLVVLRILGTSHPGIDVWLRVEGAKQLDVLERE